MLVGQVKPNLDGPPGAGHGGCPGSAGVTHLISPLGPWPSPDPRTMARPGAAASRDERASRTSTVRRPDWTNSESAGRVGIDSCNRCRKRASGDALPARLRLVPSGSGGGSVCVLASTRGGCRTEPFGAPDGGRSGWWLGARPVSVERFGGSLPRAVVY